MIEKKNWLPLKVAKDCVSWAEKVANEVTQDPHSISQANARAACVKVLPGIKKLQLDYARFKAKNGALSDMQEFFA